MITDQGRCHSLGSIDTFLETSETNGQPEKEKSLANEKRSKRVRGPRRRLVLVSPVATTTHNPLTHAQKQILASAIAYLHFNRTSRGRPSWRRTRHVGLPSLRGRLRGSFSVASMVADLVLYCMLPTYRQTALCVSLSDSHRDSLGLQGSTCDFSKGLASFSLPPSLPPPLSGNRIALYTSTLGEP